MISNTRGPASLNELVNELAPAVTAASLQDALEADIILLPVQFAAHAQIAKARKDWKGKTVVDVTNFRETDLTPLGGLQSSDFVAMGLPVRDLSSRSISSRQLSSRAIRSRAADGGRRVMFVAGNHDEANTEVASLVASRKPAAVPRSARSAEPH